jgi:hypothetical protein
LQFCHDDARCKVGIDLDSAPLGSVVAGGVHQSFTFLLNEHRGEADAPEVQAKIDHLYNRLPSDRRVELTIHGANHFGFSDDGALLKSPMVMKILNATGVLKLEGPRQINITRHYIDAFFDSYLKDRQAPQFRDNQAFPEVTIRP